MKPHSRLLAMIGEQASSVKLIDPPGRKGEHQPPQERVSLADVLLLAAAHLQDKEQVPDAVAEQLKALQEGQERLIIALSQLNALLAAPVMPVYDAAGKLLCAVRKPKGAK